MSDVIIIGGGVAGLSLAAAMSGHASVTLLEAEPALGYHASGRSAALFELGYGNRAVQELTRASEADYLSRDVLTPRGVMLVANAGQVDQAMRETEHMGLEPLTTDEARNMVPILSDSLRYAAISRSARDIDTDRLLQAYAREARQNGAHIHTGATVSKVEKIGARWRVQAADTVIEARVVVNAAGAWADQVAQLAGAAPVGLQPLRRSIARIAAPGGLDVAQWPMILGAGESFYAKPDAGALIVSPGEEHLSEPMDAWADDLVLAEGLENYQEMVTEPVTRPLATWAGLRTFAPDRTLVIGHDPEVAGFFWVSGQGGYGFQTAPGAAALARDLLLGRKPDLPDSLVSALAPARFAVQTNSG